MPGTDPERALDFVHRIEQMCDFIELPALRRLLEENVLRPLPPAPGALGFDVQLWCGLGVVGLWAILDAFAERGGMSRAKCARCGSTTCVQARYTRAAHGNVLELLGELEDLRHLFAHNFAGQADAEYFDWLKRNGKKGERHALEQGAGRDLASGAHFDGQRVHLDLAPLRAYAEAVRGVLQRVPRATGK